MFIIYIHKIYRNSKLFARFAHMNGLWKTLLINENYFLCVCVHLWSATIEPRCVIIMNDSEQVICVSIIIKSCDCVYNSFFLHENCKKNRFTRICKSVLIMSLNFKIVYDVNATLLNYVKHV